MTVKADVEVLKTQIKQIKSSSMTTLPKIEKILKKFIQG